jgi:hypothetical protein
MSATYAIYTSPTHKPIPDHLPTLIITPHGKPQQILYTYLHTNYNRENYLLTPSDQGDLCVAKLFPPSSSSSKRPNSNGSNSQPGSVSSHHHSDRNAIRCEASRNLRWTIRNEGIQNPVYKLTLPNPDNSQIEQPLFQVSKPNPNCPWWTLFYFTLVLFLSFFDLTLYQKSFLIIHWFFSLDMLDILFLLNGLNLVRL